MIAIGEHQQVGGGGAGLVQRILHFGRRNQIKIGSTQPAGRDAGAGEKRRLVASLPSHFSAQAIPDRRHDKKSRFG